LPIGIITHARIRKKKENHHKLSNLIRDRVIDKINIPVNTTEVIR
jgi:hypothetical protein